MVSESNATERISDPNTGSDDTDFPHGLCDKSVELSQNAFQCDGCDVVYEQLWIKMVKGDLIFWDLQLCAEKYVIVLFRSSHDDNSDTHTTHTTVIWTPNRTTTPTTHFISSGFVNMNAPIIHMIDSVKPVEIIGMKSGLELDIASSE